MADTDLAVERLCELKELGVALALDDFGTGYSSLSYLSRFPVDILKMDRSFLRGGATPEAAGLASAVVGLGATLSLEVVAEGIEMPGQRDTLREMGCDLGQGFLFARPMDRRRVADLPRRRRRPPLMLHSHEALDRPGGVAQRGLLDPAAPPRLPAAVGRDVRVAAGRRRVPRRARVAGLPAQRRADRDGPRRHRDDGADDRVPAGGRRGERSLRPAAADAGGRPGAAAGRRDPGDPVAHPRARALARGRAGHGLRHGSGVLRAGVRRVRARAAPRARARRRPTRSTRSCGRSPCA